MKSMTGFGRSSNRGQMTSHSLTKISSKNQKSLAVVKSSAGRAKSARKKDHESASEVASRSLDVELEIAIKSVNGRFLETRFHMPREYASLENEFKAMLGKVFSRGTIDVYVNRTRSRKIEATRLVLNKPLAREIAKAHRELAAQFGVKQNLNLDLLLNHPNVLQVESSASEVSELSDPERSLALELMRDAVWSCEQERLREGVALRTELERLCSELEKIAKEAEAFKGLAQAELERRYKERIEDAIRKLGMKGQVDDQRLAQEMVILLDRADITEELTRLREHLSAYRKLLQSPDPQGKKLDFYAQELLREINTIGSKSHVARLTSLVVDAKTLVEKIREQVQNAE